MHEAILGVDFVDSPLGKTLVTSVVAAIVGIVSAQLSSRFNENARKRKRWEEYHSGLWEKKFEVYSDFIFRAGGYVKFLSQFYIAEISGRPSPNETIYRLDELQTDYFYALRRVQVICTKETAEAISPIIDLPPKFVPVL